MNRTDESGMTKSASLMNPDRRLAGRKAARAFVFRDRRVLAAGFLLLLLPACSVLQGPLDDDTDDFGDMEPHPWRTEMPSLVGPDSSRVRSARFPVVKFEGDSWKLPPGEHDKIRSVAGWLTGNPERVLLVAGARAESPEYSRQLSDLRAQTVRKALLSAGVPESKILTVSFGEDAPGATDGVSFSLIAISGHP